MTASPDPLPDEQQTQLRGLMAAKRAEDLRVPEHWLPVDLAPFWDGLIDGSLELPAPTVGSRADGGGLFYPARINGVFGRFGSAKSFVVAVAALSELDQGGSVIWIDFEDNPTGMVQRLIELGAGRADVLERFHYLNPGEALVAQAKADFYSWVAAEGPTLVVADSAGEWLSLDGVQPNADEEISAWLKSSLAPLARTGAAVVTIDHVPHNVKDQKLRAIGSQRKMAGITGVAYLVEMVREMGRGRSGMTRLTSAKDRLGTFPRGSVVAELTIDATTTPYTVTLEAPTLKANIEGPLPDEKPAVRRVYSALNQVSKPVGTRRLGDIIADDGTGFGLKRRTIQEALTRLARLDLAERGGHAHSGYEWSISGRTLEQVVAEGEAERGAEPVEDLPDPY